MSGRATPMRGRRSSKPYQRPPNNPPSTRKNRPRSPQPEYDSDVSVDNSKDDTSGGVTPSLELNMFNIGDKLSALESANGDEKSDLYYRVFGRPGEPVSESEDEMAARAWGPSNLDDDILSAGEWESDE